MLYLQDSPRCFSEEDLTCVHQPSQNGHFETGAPRVKRRSKTTNGRGGIRVEIIIK